MRALEKNPLFMQGTDVNNMGMTLGSIDENFKKQKKVSGQKKV